MKNVKPLLVSALATLALSAGFQASAAIPGVDNAPGHGSHMPMMNIPAAQGDVSPLTGADDRGLDTQPGNNR